MFIELHLIQNFAPSCLNRDDTNSPKDCVFGGVRRARISSQCVKRSIRQHSLFRGQFEDLADRSRWPVAEIAKQLNKLGHEKDLAPAVGLLMSALIKAAEQKEESQDQNPEEKKRKRKTGEYERAPGTIWLTPADFTNITAFAVKHKQEILAAKKKDAKNALVKEFCTQYERFPQTPDVALFGRMVANALRMNVDAACQVAHAISTNKVDVEMDFFTAVDDLDPEDTSGADMMGTVEFNSACFYRYSVIHWEKLVENLGNDVELAKKTVKAFVNAAIHAIPTGKQNTFAAQNPPSLGFGLVRENAMPWSLANAFENPVRANGKGLVPASIDALAAYYRKLRDVYEDTPKVAVHFCVEEECACETLGEHKKKVADFVDALVAALSEAAS